MIAGKVEVGLALPDNTLAVGKTYASAFVGMSIILSVKHFNIGKIRKFTSGLDLSRQLLQNPEIINYKIRYHTYMYN
jgi:hypothetical protein